jgi:HEAT repeat protein
MKWCIVAIYILSISFQALSQNITITGYVYNRETGKPIPLVNVSTVGNNHLKDDQTDSEGLFVISLKRGINAGDLIRIRATKEGYEVYDERIVVSSLKPVNIQISPIPKITSTTREKMPAESMLSNYIKNLKDKDSSVRKEACKSLGYMGEKAKIAASDLISLALYDASSSVKISAIDALSSINTSSKEAVECFLKSLKSENPQVRAAAAKALGGISPASSEVIKALISGLKDKELKVQVYSVQSLLLLDKSLYGYTIPLLQFTLVNRDEEIRTVAFNTVMSLDSLPREILSLLIQIFFEEFSRTGEKSSKESEDYENYNQIIERTIKALIYFEKKGQHVNDTILGYNKLNKHLSSQVPELWLKGDTSLKAIEFIVSLIDNYTYFSLNRNYDTSFIWTTIKKSTNIIPVLKKHLQSNVIEKTWIIEQLLKLDSNLIADLSPYILEVSRSTNIYAWKEVIDLLNNYNFNMSLEYEVLVKAILADDSNFKETGSGASPDDNFYYSFSTFFYEIKIPALELLISQMSKDVKASQFIIEIINKSDKILYYKTLSQVLDSRSTDNKILEALWNHRPKDSINNTIYAPSSTTKLLITRLNSDPKTLPEMENWFNKLNSRNQISIIQYIQDYGVEAKNTIPILINALKKSSNIQYAAVACLQEIGPAAIQSIPNLKEAKETTNDANLKRKIEDAIRVIEDN